VEPMILLVEDEALVALALQDSLEEGGYAVHSVESGTDAIAIIDNGEPVIAGLITDIRLSGGPDGWMIARHARQVYPGIPVVYMSGDSAADHTSQGVPNSVMLQKPFVSAQLVTAISTLLNQVPPA
jgi:two-component system cell cycle response regulator CpdR